MKRFITWYGVLVIFLAMWLGTSFVYWNQLRDQAVHEAQQHQQPFDESEFRTEYWAGYFENHQSEYAQLFFQALLIGALGTYIFKKEKEELIRIEQKLDAVLTRQGIGQHELQQLSAVD
jgi:hypothetical protein